MKLLHYIKVSLGYRYHWDTPKILIEYVPSITTFILGGASYDKYKMYKVVNGKPKYTGACTYHSTHNRYEDMIEYLYWKVEEKAKKKAPFNHFYKTK